MQSVRSSIAVGLFSVALLLGTGVTHAQTYPSDLGYGYDSWDWYQPYDGYNWYDPCEGSGMYGYSGCYDPYTYNNYYDYYDYNNYNDYYSNWYCGYYPYYCQQQQNTLSITNVTGPTSLNVGQQGTWSITTNGAANTSLSVDVTWGDENNGYSPYGAAAQQVTNQTSLSHAYQRPGSYTITFTVRDSYGHSDTATRTVLVSGQTSGGGQFQADRTSGSVPLTVTFTATGSNGSYYVDFGDGTSGPMNPAPTYYGGTPTYVVSHTYQSMGTYTASASYAPYCAPGMYCAQMLQNLGSVTITVYGQVGCHYNQYGQMICY